MKTITVTIKFKARHEDKASLKHLLPILMESANIESLRYSRITFKYTNDKPRPR